MEDMISGRAVSPPEQFPEIPRPHNTKTKADHDHNDHSDSAAVSDASGRDTKEGSLDRDHEAAATAVCRELAPPEGTVDIDDDDMLEVQRQGEFLPKLPGIVGTPWAWQLPRITRGAVGVTAADKAERTRDVMIRMLERNERQQLLFLWRLNATRAKASALAVWAVDQGNRKAYEVERSLMAENSWATRSIIWEGYRHSPLVGISDSCWFWTTQMEHGGLSMERMREELKMARQRNAFLASQLDSARRQLIEWQEVADFQNMDGTWQSMRLRESERQLRAARAAYVDHKERARAGPLRSPEIGNHESPVSDERAAMQARHSAHAHTHTHTHTRTHTHTHTQVTLQQAFNKVAASKGYSVISLRQVHIVCAVLVMCVCCRW